MVKLIAVDDQSWKGTEKPPFPVEKLDYSNAITKYTPDIVFASWMPDEDWTPTFRMAPSVQEYILIGEPEGGSCGTGATWMACPGEGDLDLPGTDLSSGFYQVGLQRHKFGKNGVWSQIGRTDNLPLDREFSYSETVSFRRIGA